MKKKFCRLRWALKILAGKNIFISVDGFTGNSECRVIDAENLITFLQNEIEKTNTRCQQNENLKFVRKVINHGKSNNI